MRPINDFRSPCVLLAGILMCGLVIVDVASAVDTISTTNRPNFLVFTVDDMDAFSAQYMSHTQPGLTPTMDRLAGEGMSFLKAHVPAPTCGPSRHSFMTGVYPHQNGSYGFYKVSRDVPSVSSVLMDCGYFTASIGKGRDYNSFPWDHEEKDVWLGKNWYGRRPATFANAVRKTIHLARQADKPFYIGCNTSDPHRPFPGSHQESEHVAEVREKIPDDPGYPPMEPFCSEQQTRLPGYLPELPDVRKEYTQYLTAVRRADDCLAAVLSVLEDEEVADNTLVVFYSDHDASFPTAKGQTFWHSTHVPLIIRWPGQIQAGSVNRHDIINIKDLMPTLLEAADAPLPKAVAHKSLLPLWKGETMPNRRLDSIYTTWNFFLAGCHYRPCRGLHTGRYSLVFNPLSDGRWTMPECESMSGLAWAAMVRAAEEDVAIARRVEWFLHRQRIELYDRERDPWSLKNVADDPAYAQVLADMLERHLQHADLAQSHRV